MHSCSPELCYISRPRINELLDRGVYGKLTFLSADIGWGKSTAVTLWADKQKTPIYRFTVKESEPYEVLEHIYLVVPTEDDNRQIIIIDDFHLLIGTQAWGEYIEFIKHSKPLWSFVLLSQSPVPDELKPYADIYQLELISKEALRFNEEETRAFFEKSGFSLDSISLLKIRRAARGWAMAMNTIRYALQESCGIYNQEVYLQAQEELFSRFDRTLLASWSPRVQELMMKISIAREIGVEFAMVVTGQADSAQILQRLCQGGGYITFIPPDHYRLSPFLMEYLERQRNKTLSPEVVSELYQGAGLWYETQGDKARALDFYIKAGNFEKAIPLLEDAAQHHAGAANFYELEPYYKALPEDVIMESPILCSGVACMYSLNYRMEEARHWYERLLSMRDTLPHNDRLRRRVLEEKIIYTTMVLPAAGEKQLIGIFKHTAKLIMSGNLTMQDTTMTGNLPSLMRGSKDFSHWSNHAYTMRALMRPVIELLFGKYAVGLADVGVAEALYEKNELSTALVELTKGIAEVEQRGTPEIMYAGYTLMARLMTANGQANAYQTIMANTLHKINSWNAPYLLPNCRATMVRFSILKGEEAVAQEWLYEHAPDETAGFRILDRYQYLTKARVYIQNEMYPQGIALLELLHRFFVDYQRPLDLTEDFILQAIIFERMGEEQLSLQRLKMALAMAQKRSFIRVFADEGEPCYRLLLKYNKHKSDAVKDKFLKEVLQATRSFALLYPRYLAPKKTLKSELTKTEFEVLQLLERSMTNGEIAEFMDVSLDTVKFHTKNIYSKLGVKSRAQAVRLAQEQGVL